MSASKSRRSQIDEVQERNMGPQAGRSGEENMQSSDSDEISVIEENQINRNKKVKKTARKVKSNEDEILERTLRESGIDFTDMTREEKVNIAQVIMMSKEEAEIHSQSFGDESRNYSDSEEEKQNTDAFMQAIHPKQSRVAAQESVIPESQNDNIYNQETQENQSDIYNQGTQENQSNNNTKSYDPYMDQSTVDIQPTSDAATGRFNISEHASPVNNSKLDPVSEVVLHLNQQTSSAFEEAVHPPSPIDVDMMEENPVPKEIEKQKNTLSVKPIQQKQLKKQHMPRKIDKNQPRIDNFSHVVITDEKQNIIDNQDVKAVISDDDSSQERKKIRVFKKTATAIRDDISDTESLKEVVNTRKNFTLAHSKEEEDVIRNFTRAQLKELISEDENSPVKRVVTQVEDSPVKRVVKSAKKAFEWNDSDEETQDLFTIKQEDVGSVEDKQNISPRSNASNTVNDDLVADSIVKDEPSPEEFYKFPSLKRHYRNVKKKEDSTPTLFAPLDSNPKDYTKAILQLFTLYHNRLARLQKISKNCVKWPKEPVRVGFHLDNTIDARKRGLNYDFLDDQDASTSVIPIVVDMKENSNPQRPAAKNFSFKIRKEQKVHNADEEINQFVDTFISKPGLRSGRTRNTDTFTKEKSAFDFEPYPVDETFKVSAEKGKKRKLYNESDTKYCPLIEDESSNDFDDRFVGKGKRNLKLKKQNNEGNGEVPEKPETKSSRKRSNISDKTTNVKKVTRGSLKRHASDLSTGSVESFKSDDMNNLLNPDRAASRSPELSLGGLSQKSDVLLDAEGQLYSTQLCSMKEKRARVPVSKSSFNLDIVDDDSVQYLSQNSRNGSNHERETISPNTSHNVVGASTQSNFRPIIPKQSEDHTSQASQKHIGKTTNAKIMIIQSSQKTVKNTEPVGEQSTLKSRLFGHMSDMFKLGSGDQSSSSKSKNSQDPQGSHIRKKSFGDDDDLYTETQRFQQTNDVKEDDIQQINMKTEGIKTYSKKQGRKRQLTNEDAEPNKQPKMITVPCPLCNKQFPQDQIENHAADCNGPVDDDNSRESTDSVQIQEIQAGRNLEQSTSGVQRHNHGRASKKQDQDADFIVNEGKVKKKVQESKSFSMECYICDKSFRNKKMWDQHVEKCLDEARQMQHEIDTRGLDSTLEPGEIPPPKRATRSARTVEPHEGQ